MKTRIALLTAGLAAAMPALAAEVEIQPRGRLHLDYAAHDEDARSLGDGFRVRRARLGVSGKIDSDWRYVAEFDFAEDDVNAKDLYLRYTGWSAADITIGHAKVPFGLEELTSSNSISFIERALPVSTFAHSRRLGVGVATGGDAWHFAAMGFGQGVGSGTRDSDGDEGLGAGARFVFNPLSGGDTVVHLGIAAATEEPADSQASQVRFSTRPESRPTKVRLVDTGTLEAVDRIDRLGLEAAWRRGPWSVQGEWMQARVARGNGSEDADLSGYYLSASWVVTGESRDYRNGVFRGISPQRSTGAWELVARYSDVDLDDGAVSGGQESNFTLGANWYANDRIRFMANAIFTDSERQGVNDDPRIFLLRAQISF